MNSIKVAKYLQKYLKADSVDEHMLSVIRKARQGEWSYIKLVFDAEKQECSLLTKKDYGEWGLDFHFILGSMEDEQDIFTAVLHCLMLSDLVKLADELNE